MNNSDNRIWQYEISMIEDQLIEMLAAVHDVKQKFNADDFELTRMKLFTVMEANDNMQYSISTMRRKITNSMLDDNEKLFDANEDLIRQVTALSDKLAAKEAECINLYNGAREENFYEEQPF